VSPAAGKPWRDTEKHGEAPLADAPAPVHVSVSLAVAVKMMVAKTMKMEMNGMIKMKKTVEDLVKERWKRIAEQARCEKFQSSTSYVLPPQKLS